MKIFAISDLHLDYKENADWLQSLSSLDYQQDILILAGDISDNIELIEACFKQLTNKFKQVIFVPGNHDLWVRRGEQKNSFEKFKLVQEIAQRNGVCMENFDTDDLTIVPLLGWYDYSFGQPNEALKARWMDYIACKWPDNFTDASITEYFTQHNESRLQVKNKTIISFSHFLPRIDVMPPFIPPYHQMLYPVLGSSRIEAQIRKINPQIHVYGHSHLNQKIKIDNIYYINNAFGNPLERRITRKELLCIFEI